MLRICGKNVGDLPDEYLLTSYARANDRIFTKMTPASCLTAVPTICALDPGGNGGHLAGWWALSRPTCHTAQASTRNREHSLATIDSSMMTLSLAHCVWCEYKVIFFCAFTSTPAPQKHVPVPNQASELAGKFRRFRSSRW